MDGAGHVQFGPKVTRGNTNAVSDFFLGQAEFIPTLLNVDAKRCGGLTSAAMSAFGLKRSRPSDQ